MFTAREAQGCARASPPRTNANERSRRPADIGIQGCKPSLGPMHANNANQEVRIPYHCLVMVRPRSRAEGIKRISGSRPISRVLFRPKSVAIIHLGTSSPTPSSNLPEGATGRSIAFLFGLAPSGVYLAAECCHLRGALLPHHFTLTCLLLAKPAGGLFSVALSVGSRLPGVTWHSALRSPDFPPGRPYSLAGRLPGRLPGAFYLYNDLGSA